MLRLAGMQKQHCNWSVGMRPFCPQIKAPINDNGNKFLVVAVTAGTVSGTGKARSKHSSRQLQHAVILLVLSSSAASSSALCHTPVLPLSQHIVVPVVGGQ